MRTKSEARKQAILDAAAEVFQKEGYERASMDEICRHLGYSKATLYNYFPSKEELFFSVVFEATSAQFHAIHEALDPSMEDIEEALLGFGRSLLALVYSPAVQAVLRLVASEAGRGGLGKQCYEVGASQSLSLLGAYLERAMERGKLRRADSRTAALHLLGLLESEWHMLFLCQVRESVSPEEIRGSVARALEVFFKAYGPEPVRGASPGLRAGLQLGLGGAE